MVCDIKLQVHILIFSEMEEITCKYDQNSKMFCNFKYNAQMEHDFKDSRTDRENISKHWVALESSTSSLLTVLDDKNRMIELLRQQLHNQKVQLGYYLHNAIVTPKLLQLSKTCSFDQTEDSIPLTFAMDKYYKTHGLKSRMMNLHDRMGTIDKRISAMIERQEHLCCRIIETLMECANHSLEGENSVVRLLRICSKCEQFNIFNEMLRGTINLRKELDTFRVCCDRLIAVEDERNNIVEQVYSTPVGQRVNCNYVIGYQVEKRRLEIEMEEIRKEQKELEQKIFHLNKFSNKLPNADSSDALVADDMPIGMKLHKMLEVINSDAKSILSISQAQKDKYTTEISKLIHENHTLRHKLEALDVIGQKNKEITQKITNLEHHYIPVIEDLQRSNQKEISIKDAEIENLKLNLARMTDECHRLQENVSVLAEVTSEVEILRLEKEKLYELSKERNELMEKVDSLDEVSKERDSLKIQIENLHKVSEERDHLKNELQTISEVIRERDHLRTEVENLQSIRFAYANIIEQYEEDTANKCDYSELEAEQEKRKEIELRHDELYCDVQHLKDSVVSQQQQIKQLLCIIQKLMEHESSDCFGASTNNQNELSTPLLIDASKEQENILIEKTNTFRREKENLRTKAAGDTSSNKIPTKVIYPEADRSEKFSQPMCQRNTFEIFATDKHGNVESMKAILHCSSLVEGIIRMDNVPNLSLKVKCTPKTSVKNVTLKQQPVNKDNEINEFELMKDCSEETLIVECPPCRFKSEQLQMPSLDNINITQICHKKTYSVIDSSPSQNKELAISSKTEISNVSNDLTYNVSETIKHVVDYNNNSCDDFNERVQSVGDVVDKLKIISNELDSKLARPGGRTVLLGTLKEVYGCYFSDEDDLDLEL